MPNEELDLRGEILKATALAIGREADTVVEHLYGHVKSDAAYNGFVCMLNVDEKGVQTYKAIVGLIVSKLCMRLAQEWIGWTNITPEELEVKLKQIKDDPNFDPDFTPFG